jgi:cytochrome c biogenesis protein
MAVDTEGAFTELEPADEVIRQPTLGLGGWLRWGWRQLTSMRTALLLLFLLAVAAVPGSMLPQRRADPSRVGDYLSDHATTGPWLDRLGFFDVYSSPWFSAIYLLLFVSLVGCVVPRARLHLRAMRSAPPRTPRRLERLDEYQQVEAPSGTSAKESLDAARFVLAWRRYRLADYDGSVAAERGYLAETGNLVFHLALLALLVALAWSSLASYSGQAIVVEGRSFANVVTQYDSFSAGPLVDTGDLPPFSFTLDRFTVAFETGAEAGGRQLGSPRQFDAALTVRDSPGAPARTLTVRPNHPLDVNGTRAFLVGNGYAPMITVTDGNGDVAFRGPVVTRPQDGNYKSVMVVKVPDATPRQIGLAGVFLPTYDLDDGVPVSLFPQPLTPRLMLLAFVSRPGEDGLNVNNGIPQSVMRLDTRKMTQLKAADGAPLRILIEPGATATLPDGAGTVRFDGVARYAALDIRRDPSKGWALGTSLLALAGVSASLFVRRRRVWVRATEDADGRTVVEVAGLARGEDGGLAAEIASVASILGGPDGASTTQRTTTKE